MRRTQCRRPLRRVPGGRGRASTSSASRARRRSSSTARSRTRPSSSSLFDTSRAAPTWPTCTAASRTAPASASGRSGPGATNLVTAVADAWLDRSPLVALTGQGDLERTHKESHQYIDVVSMFKPITKWNTRLNSAGDDPRGGAQGVQGRPGARSRARRTSSCPRTSWTSTVGDAQPLAHRQERRRPEPSPGRARRGRRDHPRRRVPADPGRQRRLPRRRRARAARLRPRDRHGRRRDLHGQGRPRRRRPALARHGRHAGARLRAGRLRARRRGHHRRLRPRRARAGQLEPQGQQDDRLHRHGRRRGRRALRHRRAT